MANPYRKFVVHGSCREMSEVPASHDRNASTLDFFERLGCGCILIDGSGRILKANRYAGRYFGRDIIVRNGRLAAADPTTDTDLQRLIGAVLAGASQEAVPGAVALWRDTGHPLIVQAAPVDGPVPPAYAGARGVIRIIDLGDTTEIAPADVLQTAFQLTPAEAKVAQRIACGDSPEQIAERHNVSPGTVREQLKAVFQKTRTHRQSQLVGLLDRLGRLSR